MFGRDTQERCHDFYEIYKDGYNEEAHIAWLNEKFMNKMLNDKGFVDWVNETRPESNDTMTLVEKYVRYMKYGKDAEDRKKFYQWLKLKEQYKPNSMISPENENIEYERYMNNMEEIYNKEVSNNQ